MAAHRCAPGRRAGRGAALSGPHVVPAPFPSGAASPDVEGWRQVGELGLAFGLSAVIGLERELRQKSAGLRTHTLVGLGAALFVLVSKFGFGDVLHPGTVVVDPSRVAAQIVTGIGFLGAGLIFVRRDAVRGLTAAAAVWLTAAVGAAAGAGLWLLALFATVGYFVTLVGFSSLVRRLPPSSTAISEVVVHYADGRGVLRRVLEAATDLGFSVARVGTEPRAHGGGSGGAVTVSLEVRGRGSVQQPAAALAGLDGVLGVSADDVNRSSD
ncbi:MAG: MgtC/SapB family protein [Acidimicrobiales bacterium]